MTGVEQQPWCVVDLFSGAGGMSYGFHAHPRFRVIGAVDAQVGKPSSGLGTLECNSTFKANIGLEPIEENLATLSPRRLRESLSVELGGRDVDVLTSCAPCTGFSRTIASNHLIDDPRNSLASRSALFVEEFRPSIFIMENARELIAGRFAHHFANLREHLIRLGYRVHGKALMLDRFGLPQRRERALVVAVREGLPLRTLEDLWDGYRVNPEATHVRRAISHFPPVAAGEAHPSDPLHVSPRLSNGATLRRLQRTTRNGGSWADLRHDPASQALLTPAMVRYISRGDFGSHPDVYGRLWWDRPAVTVKRECGHVGNGRYAHPEQDRLCTVREMSVLQGFPNDYLFVAANLSNMYRHIGDAAPPLISYQLAKVCEWIFTDIRPPIESAILPRTHLSADDVQQTLGHQTALPLTS